MRRVSLHPAYILHTRPFRDTSLICECFTEQFGRVAGIARGARGNKSKRKGLLQPFMPLVLSWQGRGELVTLTKIEANGPPTLNLQHTGLLSGLYLNELLMRLLHHHDPHPDLFAQYADTLPLLGDSNQLDIALRRFEKNCLADIGYGLPLADFALGNQPGANWYRYHVQHGFTPCDGPSDNAYSVACLQAIAQDDLSDSTVRQTCKHLMRQALAARLGSKPLKTRELFQPIILETEA